MRNKLLLLTIAMFGCMTANAQNYVVNSTFEPLSYSQIAAKVAYGKRMADNYFDKAYEYYNKGDMQGFIYYSDIAMSYGWYSSECYYDRGVAYERLHDYKHAKKNYKKALKKGYYPARSALESCKISEKAWKAANKR